MNFNGKEYFCHLLTNQHDKHQLCSGIFIVLFCSYKSDIKIYVFRLGNIVYNYNI